MASSSLLSSFAPSIICLFLSLFLVYHRDEAGQWEEVVAHARLCDPG